MDVTGEGSGVVKQVYLTSGYVVHIKCNVVVEIVAGGACQADLRVVAAAVADGSHAVVGVAAVAGGIPIG